MMLVLMVPIQNAVRQFTITIDSELNVTSSSSGKVVARQDLRGHVQMATARYSQIPCLFITTESPMVPLQFIARFNGVCYNEDEKPVYLGEPYLKELEAFWADLKKHGWVLPSEASSKSSQETWSPSSERQPRVGTGIQDSHGTNSTGTWSPPPEVMTGGSARVVGKPPKELSEEKQQEDQAEATASGAPGLSAAPE